MRIGDNVYFAPGIRFSEVNLNSTGLPEQFRCRMDGFYVQPAERCARRGDAFAAGVLLVSCVDALARLRYGKGVGVRFKKFVRKDLRSFSSVDLSTRFYEEFRNGLVHEGRLKKGACFSLESNVTVEQHNGTLLVNPKRLATEVREALESYVALLTRNDAERQRFARTLKDDLRDDLNRAAPPFTP